MFLLKPRRPQVTSGDLRSDSGREHSKTHLLPPERAESDSSYYEPYGEEDDDDEEDDGKEGGPVKDKAIYIQWSASQPCLRPAPESRLCDYLWRRKWLGQWSKQLFIIRKDVLLVRRRSSFILVQLLQ